MAMEILKGWQHTGLPAGLIATAFVSGTYAMLALPVRLPLLVLAFCGGFLVYQLDRWPALSPEDRHNHPERRQWLRRHPGLVWGAVALVVVAGAVEAWQLRTATLIGCVGLGLMSLFYTLPLLPGRRRLKSVWMVKPLCVSAGWAFGGVVLPVLEAGVAVTTGAWLLLLHRFLFVLPNALFTDWADRQGDAATGLRTVGTQWSRRRIQQVATVLLGGALLGSLIAPILYSASPLLFIDLVGPLLMLWAVWYLPGVPSRRYGGVVDAIIAWPAVPALVAWVGEWVMRNV